MKKSPSLYKVLLILSNGKKTEQKLGRQSLNSARNKAKNICSSIEECRAYRLTKREDRSTFFEDYERGELINYSLNDHDALGNAL